MTIVLDHFTRYKSFYSLFCLLAPSPLSVWFFFPQLHPLLMHRPLPLTSFPVTLCDTQFLLQLIHFPTGLPRVPMPAWQLPVWVVPADPPATAPGWWYPRMPAMPHLHSTNNVPICMHLVAGGYSLPPSISLPMYLYTIFILDISRACS